MTVPDLRDLEGDIAEWLQEGRSILILSRNRCWLQYAESFLDKAALPIRRDWHTVHRRARRALQNIRLSGIITEEDYAAILPSVPTSQKGELRQDAYWDKGVVKALRKGSFENDPQLMAGYELLRFEGGVALHLSENVGLLPTFRDDIRRDIPWRKWTLSQDELATYDECTKSFGQSFPEIRLSTIHAAKGEEADVVIILSNITSRTEQSEREEEDNERRVFYVGTTRARDVLVITKIATFSRTSNILI
jgi:superfamily I DNA/RNA helicase